MAGLSNIVDILKSPKGLALLTGAGAATQSEDAEAIFAGPKAKMADMFMEGVARKMRVEGRDPNEIFQKTGWFRAPDGNWKFEIPDTKADFKPGIDNIIGDQYGTPQKHGFEHEMLYANYPELRDVELSKVSKAGENRGLRGSFRPPKYRMQAEDVGARHPYTDEILTDEMVGTPLEPGKIEIGLGRGEAPARSTMLHENQHSVQEIEGWQGGASDSWFNNREADKWSEKINQVSAKMGELYDKRHVLAAASKRETNPAKKAELWAARDALKPRLDNLKKLTNQLKDKRKDNEPYGLYQRVMGETEARAVQKRDALDRAYKAGDSPNIHAQRDPVDQGAYNEVDEIIQDPTTHPAYKYRHTNKVTRDMAGTHGEMYAPENPTLSTIGNALSKVDTPFGNPVSGIAELLQHVGMYGLEGGNQYSEIEPQTGSAETAKKLGMAAVDAVPLAKRALPMAPAIARLYEISMGQE